MGAWLWYWHQAEGNVLAVPLCAIVAVILGYIFRDTLGRRLMRWLHKHHQAELERRQQGKP